MYIVTYRNRKLAGSQIDNYHIEYESEPEVRTINFDTFEEFNNFKQDPCIGVISWYDTNFIKTKYILDGKELLKDFDSLASYHDFPHFNKITVLECENIKEKTIKLPNSLKELKMVFSCCTLEFPDSLIKAEFYEGTYTINKFSNSLKEFLGGDCYLIFDNDLPKSLEIINFWNASGNPPAKLNASHLTNLKEVHINHSNFSIDLIGLQEVNLHLKYKS